MHVSYSNNDLNVADAVFLSCSEKYTRFCQWKNLELNINVRSILFLYVHCFQKFILALVICTSNIYAHPNIQLSHMHASKIPEIIYRDDTNLWYLDTFYILWSCLEEKEQFCMTVRISHYNVLALLDYWQCSLGYLMMLEYFYFLAVNNERF